MQGLAPDWRCKISLPGRKNLNDKRLRLVPKKEQTHCHLDFYVQALIFAYQEVVDCLCYRPEKEVTSNEEPTAFIKEIILTY